MTLEGEQPLPALLAQVEATLTECARAKGVELRPHRAVAGTNDGAVSSAVRAVVASAIANVLSHAYQRHQHAFQRHVASVSWSAGGFDRFRDSAKAATAATKATGKALSWTAAKGFGFIKPDDGGEELFCHFSSILDGKALKVGATVSFVKKYDERKGKDRAEEVTGGCPVEGGFGSGDGGGGGRGSGGAGGVNLGLNLGGGGGRGSGGAGGVTGPPPASKVQGAAAMAPPAPFRRGGSGGKGGGRGSSQGGRGSSVSSSHSDTAGGWRRVG